jgi:uncharacterized protein
VAGFIGRDRELAILDRMLHRVEAGGRAGRPGRAVLMRGRRRVGKSRLAEEFVDRAGVPYLFFTASAQPDAQADLGLFIQAAASSNLPAATMFRDQRPETWDAAMGLLASALPTDRPSVVIIDEMPYLVANDAGFEGTLQKFFDRELSRRPALLLCIGSDLAMMEAFDAYLVTGGLPLILDEWPAGASVSDYLTDALADPTSALLVSGERALTAEFPVEAQARDVLTAIGSGERTHSMIGRAAGGIPRGSLSRALHLLTTRRLVAASLPLSTNPSRETRYVIADPYLRFWLAFLGPYLAEIERGRGDLVQARIESAWATWRGRAIEPVIREALRRLPGESLPAGTSCVGSYWTRTNDPEIDIVGADRAPIAKKITLVGSIKWQDNRIFDLRDAARLVSHRSQLPGADDTTPLLAVTRNGSSTNGIPVLGPEDLLAAWPA